MDVVKRRNCSLCEYSKEGKGDFTRSECVNCQSPYPDSREKWDGFSLSKDGEIRLLRRRLKFA